MCATPQQLTEVVGNGADVGAFRTVNFQLQFVPFPADKLQIVNGDAACFARNFDTLTSILIEFLALVLQRRIHRRHLLDIAAEAVQRRIELRLGEVHRTFLHNLAVGVRSIGALTQSSNNAIAFVGVEQEL
ncbi:hypothetical protein D3C72_1215450 [compost metagenome]